MIIEPQFSLAVAMGFLLLYVAGNGIIHTRQNKLERDTLIEYVILSVIALVILIDAMIK